MSFTLVTLAGPLLHAATAVSTAVVNGAERAFDKFLHAGEAAPAENSEQLSGGSIAGLEAQAESLLAKIETRSLRRLAEAGVTLDAPLVLESDALDELHVAGDHSQAAAIERALAGDRELNAMVEELQSVNRKLARERQAEANDRLFALDPSAAGKLLDQTSPLDELPLRVTLRPLEFTL